MQIRHFDFPIRTQIKWRFFRLHDTDNNNDNDISYMKDVCIIWIWLAS